MVASWAHQKVALMAVMTAAWTVVLMVEMKVDKLAADLAGMKVGNSVGRKVDHWVALKAVWLVDN